MRLCVRIFLNGLNVVGEEWVWLVGKGEKTMKRGLFILAFSFVYFICGSAFGHLLEIGDYNSSTPFELVDWTEQQFEHQDEDPFKGWAFVYVKNTSQTAWGDFHFEIYDYDDADISNVHFIVDSPYQPVSSQTGLSWLVNNDVVGATLDLYFYSDPVLPNEIATFQVYTDNTTDEVNFGLQIHPTEVPEPASLLLFGLGGFALFRKRKA
jgi:hypothetical protein